MFLLEYVVPLVRKLFFLKKQEIKKNNEKVAKKKTEQQEKLDAMKKKLKSAQKSAKGPQSFSDWNKLILLACFGFIMSGCLLERHVYVQPELYEIPLPERPHLIEEEPLTENAKRLMQYAYQLKVTIKEHNKMVQEFNNAQ